MKINSKNTIGLTDKQINWVAGNIEKEVLKELRKKFGYNEHDIQEGDTLLESVRIAITKTEEAMKKDIINELFDFIEKQKSFIQGRIYRGIAHDFDTMKNVWEGQIQGLNLVYEMLIIMNKQDGEKVTK